MYQVENGSYPSSLSGVAGGNYCPSPTDDRYCIKASSGTTLTYNAVGSGNTGFTLDATLSGITYRITDGSGPVASASLAVSDPTNWLAIGTQVWAKANLNVGTMVTGVTTQTNNAVLEKYCYADTESNCTTYGGLYQWDEAMQYVTTQGAQGICPAGSHIPSDNDWKILEMQLGMTQAQADANGWRETNQGTQLKSGGTSGLNMLLAGYRVSDGSFSALLSYTYLWSSSESSTNAWHRRLTSGYWPVGRDTSAKSFGFSVRCLGN